MGRPAHVYIAAAWRAAKYAARRRAWRAVRGATQALVAGATEDEVIMAGREAAWARAVTADALADMHVIARELLPGGATDAQRRCWGLRRAALALTHAAVRG